LPAGWKRSADENALSAKAREGGVVPASAVLSTSPGRNDHPQAAVAGQTITVREAGHMEPVTSKLRRTRLFANVPESGLIELVERPGVTRGGSHDRINAEAGDLVVLLEGGLAMRSHDGGNHLAAFSVDEGAREPAILYTIPRGAHLALTKPSVYLVIEGERLDALLSGEQETRSLAALQDGVRVRAASLLKSDPFKQLSFPHLVRCAEAMQTLRMSAGADVIREGDPGDYFYVLDRGSAEVLRTNNDGDDDLVATLEPGATFGEEALLQNSTRNATVRMREDGELFRLSKADFDLLLKSKLLGDISSEDAAEKLRKGKAELIDCRTDEEWELWRLPGARLMPLETIRERTRGLDPSREYIAYCRTRRRSDAAVFLMRQAGLKAYSLKGGTTAWPYEFEGLALDI
jgi:rhodanese-related sulfurtransferase